ncbi:MULTISPECIES: hypothetical protein [unclassified Achromobacter]|uniref:hypothetical protein n=1 Tax=unclassified Achromobacter TaxID=2626865 RepID=UPI00117756CC|nr:MULTISPECIES: hypothetical protein [unclassified Achromobacter]
MTPEELRLELLKLCHRHDKSAQEITAKCSELEKFVLAFYPLAEKSTKRRKPAEKVNTPASLVE